MKTLTKGILLLAAAMITVSASAHAGHKGPQKKAPKRIEQRMPALRPDCKTVELRKDALRPMRGEAPRRDNNGRGPLKPVHRRPAPPRR